MNTLALRALFGVMAATNVALLVATASLRRELSWIAALSIVAWCLWGAAHSLWRQEPRTPGDTIQHLHRLYRWHVLQASVSASTAVTTFAVLYAQVYGARAYGALSVVLSLSLLTSAAVVVARPREASRRASHGAACAEAR